MNESLFHFISFPENYTSINQCIADIKNLTNMKTILVYNNLFLINNDGGLRVHPKYGTESEFSQLCSLFPFFSISFNKLNENKNKIKLGKYAGFIHSIFYVIDRGKMEDEYITSLLLTSDKVKTYIIYKYIPSSDEINKFTEMNNSYNDIFNGIFVPFYVLDNPNSVKRQLGIIKYNTDVMKIGFYPKEVCQSFIDPRIYHLIFTLLSSISSPLMFLNGQETLRNYPSFLTDNDSKEIINKMSNNGFFNWLCETRLILKHYKNIINIDNSKSVVDIHIKRRILWLIYKIKNDKSVKIGFNFEKLFIKVSQAKIYHIKTIWYDNNGAYLDESGVKKHLAPFGIALMDNCD